MNIIAAVAVAMDTAAAVVYYYDFISLIIIIVIIIITVMIFMTHEINVKWQSHKMKIRFQLFSE